MSTSEAEKWLRDSGMKSLDSREKEVVICPPFTLLALFHSYLLEHDSTFKIGAQDVSPFPKGAYTGAVAAEQLKELASYVIIGHSERRKYFHEDEQVLQNKVDMALGAGLIPLFCVQDAQTPIPRGVKIIAYEPVFAIGSGNPDSPENAEQVAAELSAVSQERVILYGGSVTEKNVASFTAMEHVSGVLVGSASLDSSRFTDIIQHA